MKHLIVSATLAICAFPFEARTSSSNTIKPLSIKLDRVHPINDIQPRKLVKRDPSPRHGNEPLNVPLKTYLGLPFCIGMIAIGTPKRRFEVMFATGTSETWFPSLKCPESNEACIQKHRYNSENSSSYKADGRSFETKGLSQHETVIGFLSRDTISIDFPPGYLRVKNQTFVEATHVPDTDFNESPFDGIIGLGRQSTPANGSTPFFGNMVTQKVVPSPVFSLWLNPNPNGSNAGELTFGGFNREHFEGNITNVSLTSETNWQIKVDQVSVGGFNGSLCPEGCQATVDTSVPYILGPDEYVRQIVKGIFAFEYFPGIYFIPCKSVELLPNVTFKIDGEDYVFEGEEYVFKVEEWGPRDRYRCVVGFSGKDYLDSWVLGGVFIRKYYTMFDLDGEQVGFARAK